jgi:hypothetical protein
MSMERFESAGHYWCMLCGIWKETDHSHHTMEILLSVISIGQLPPIEKLSSLKHTHSLYEGNSMPVNFVGEELTSWPNVGSQEIT